MTDEERAVALLTRLGYFAFPKKVQHVAEAFSAVRADATKLEREAFAEKARAVLEHFRTSHAMHWDREGTHGANCPACKIDRETREMLRAMVKP